MSKVELDKVLEKVRKLLALAGNNPNENEAASAAEMAKRIMNEYNLSLTDVELKEIVEKVIVFETLRLDGWKSVLAAQVAKVFDCFVYKSVRRYDKVTKIVFVGNRADSEVAYYVYTYLGRVISNLIKKKVAENTTSIHGRELGRSYALGIMAVLGQRLMDFYGKEAIKNETVVSASGKTGTELIVIKHDAIEKWKENQKMNFKKGKVDNRGCEENAYFDGMVDGNGIQLTHGIKHSGKTAVAQIN